MDVLKYRKITPIFCFWITVSRTGEITKSESILLSNLSISPKYPMEKLSKRRRKKKTKKIGQRLRLNRFDDFLMNVDPEPIPAPYLLGSKSLKKS
jgi:hypothetical protein